MLLHADSNGYVYVMDRLSGEVLSAQPFVPVNTSRGVDLKTGSFLFMEERRPREGIIAHNLCPGPRGAKTGQPDAYSPQTGLLYIPHGTLCADLETTKTSYIAGTPFLGSTVEMRAIRGTPRGGLTAWDPVQAKSVWATEEDFPVASGALVTGGNVVFYGTMDGWFKALDARSGQLLWQFKAGSGIVGQPVAYRGPDGREYVAVLAGVGGAMGTVVSRDLDISDGSAGFGFANAVGDLKFRTTRGGTLYVFAIPR